MVWTNPHRAISTPHHTHIMPYPHHTTPTLCHIHTTPTLYHVHTTPTMWVPHGEQQSELRSSRAQLFCRAQLATSQTIKWPVQLGLARLKSWPELSSKEVFGTSIVRKTKAQLLTFLWLICHLYTYRVPKKKVGLEKYEFRIPNQAYGTLHNSMCHWNRIAGYV